MESLEMFHILNKALLDLSARMAKLAAENTAPFKISPENALCLITNTKGDYSLSIILTAEKKVLMAMTENMKHAPSADSDIPVYAGEFFNVLCGHIVTAVNNKVHAACRFSIPRLVEGPYSGALPPIGEGRQTLYYRSDYGLFILDVIYQEINASSCMESGTSCV